MSTGADSKTMPVTAAYKDGHERIFGPSAPVAERTSRKLYVSRCSACDGVKHETTLLFDCPRCKGKDCYGMVDASIAPPPQAEARYAPIMVDRFYEGVRATDGTDIGSRAKRREYMHVNGFADADDFKGQWAKSQERRDRIARGERGALPSKTRREAIGRALYQIDKP